MSLPMAKVATAGETNSAEQTPVSKSAPQSDQVSTVAASLDSASSRSEPDFRGWHGRPIAWDEVFLGHRIQPYHHYATCADDIYLLGRLLELARLPDVDGDSVKLLLRALRFLRRCDYSAEDVCSILAHASSYFLDAYALCGREMTASEVGNVLVTLMFLAHSYVQDETCPLRLWHQHLFKRYCELATLNAAVIRLLEIRKYMLRLADEDLAQRYALLMEVIRKPRVEEPKEGPPASRLQPAILSRVLEMCRYTQPTQPTPTKTTTPATTTAAPAAKAQLAPPAKAAPVPPPVSMVLRMGPIPEVFGW